MTGGRDWTLELYLANAPAVLTMVFRTQANAKAAAQAIALAVDGQSTAPEHGWTDADGAVIYFDLNKFIGVRMAQRSDPWRSGK